MPVVIDEFEVVAAEPAGGGAAPPAEAAPAASLEAQVERHLRLRRERAERVHAS